MRYVLSVFALTVLLGACGQSKDLVITDSPDVFSLTGVDSFSSTTAFTYSFQSDQAAGDIGTIYNGVHTKDPARSRVNIEVTSLGEAQTGELYFLEDGTVLSRPGLGPFVPLDQSVDDVIWLDSVHQAVADNSSEYDFVAEETVAGVSVSHFEGPAVFPALLRAADLAAGLAIDAEFTGKSNVWVDETTGLIMAFEVEATADDGLNFVTVSAAVRINELGGAVTIDLPDQSLIIPDNLLADDRAKTNLNDVLIAAQLFYTGDESFAGLTTGELALREPSVTYVEGPRVDSPGVMGFIAEPDRLMLVTLSETGTWFCVAEDRTELNPVVTFGGGTSNELADSFEDCSNPVWPLSTN